MDWKTLLAYITGSVDQELLLRNEYLVTENPIGQGRVPLRADLVWGSIAFPCPDAVCGAFSSGENASGKGQFSTLSCTTPRQPE
jgi:hypothetical protein